MEYLVESLTVAGFPEAVARDLATQGHRRSYAPGTLVWKSHLPMEWLIVPLRGGDLQTGIYRWDALSAIRAAAMPEMLLCDLVCGVDETDTFLIPRSVLILAARYYPEILLGCLLPFSLQKFA